MKRGKQAAILFLGATIVLMVDRIAKGWALTLGKQRDQWFPGLSFQLQFNRGITWGMFHASSSPYVFYLITLLVSALILFLGWYIGHRYRQGKSVLAEVLVLTGAFSNLLDRFLYHGVIDFIILSYGTWSWPTFNIADAMIVLGILWMILTDVRNS